jgi:hypothetical protein
LYLLTIKEHISGRDRHAQMNKRPAKSAQIQ